MEKHDVRMLLNKQRQRQQEHREDTFNAHWQPGFDKQIDDRNHCNHRSNIKHEQQLSQELLCASGGRCEGICREQHLYRPRFANLSSKKDTGVKKMWAERCPSAYEEVKHYRT